MFWSTLSHALFALSCCEIARSQTLGAPDASLELQILNCSSSNDSACETESLGLTLDANWRWAHAPASVEGCVDGEDCVLEGIDASNYEKTYGVSVVEDGRGVRLETTEASAGARLYLLSAPNASQYRRFQLLGRELSFDVDMSLLPCGMNGALYFVEMDADETGARLGTGYCDAQCPMDVRWPGDHGHLGAGSCCAEVDVWEANSKAAAFTLHSCNSPGVFTCRDESCASSCDRPGCGVNAYRLGHKDFYGQGLRVNTTRPFRVVTQFLSDADSLKTVRRHYLQDGKVIRLSGAGDDLDEDYCQMLVDKLGYPNSFEVFGGMRNISAAMSRGVVMALSLWGKEPDGMRWLDTVNAMNDTPGATPGPCGASLSEESKVSVTFSNFRISPSEKLLV